MQQPIWGIDLGGTKIEGAIIPSLNHPDPLLRIRLDTESKLGYEHILGQIKRLVDEMKEKSGLVPTTVGIGTPGAEEPSTGLMKNCNSTALIGKPFRKDIEAVLQMPVTLANDAPKSINQGFCFAQVICVLAIMSSTGNSLAP